MDVMPNGRRVLVVDDEPQVVFVLRFSLDAEGYETYTAHDGRAALQQIERVRPDLLVLDVMMPRMDGWGVLEEVRKLPRSERPGVVMVTALAGPAERAKANALGADAFLAKPFDVADLVRILHGLELDRAS